MATALYYYMVAPHFLIQAVITGKDPFWSNLESTRVLQKWCVFYFLSILFYLRYLVFENWKVKMEIQKMQNKIAKIENINSRLSPDQLQNKITKIKPRLSQE